MTAPVRSPYWYLLRSIEHSRLESSDLINSATLMGRYGMINFLLYFFYSEYHTSFLYMPLQLVFLEKSRTHWPDSSKCRHMFDYAHVLSLETHQCHFATQVCISFTNCVRLRQVGIEYSLGIQLQITFNEKPPSTMTEDLFKQTTRGAGTTVGITTTVDFPCRFARRLQS